MKIKPNPARDEGSHNTLVVQRAEALPKITKIMDRIEQRFIDHRLDIFKN